MAGSRWNTFGLTGNIATKWMFSPKQSGWANICSPAPKKFAVEGKGHEKKMERTTGADHRRRVRDWICHSKKTSRPRRQDRAVRFGRQKTGSRARNLRKQQNASPRCYRLKSC